MSTVSRAGPTATTRAERVSLLSPDSHRTLLAERTSQTRRHAYCAYGHRGSAAVAGRHGFNGEYQEPGGCYLLGSYRAYNPTLMRMHSPDSLSPFGAGGLNAYAYCLGDPVNRVDPTGHMPELAWPVIGITLSVLGLAFAGAGIATVVPAATGKLATSNLAIAAYSASTSTSLVGAAAGVGSAVLQAQDPDNELGNILGYVSLGLGVASMALGIGGHAIEASRVARQKALDKAAENAVANARAMKHAGSRPFDSGMREMPAVPTPSKYELDNPSTYGHNHPGYRPSGGGQANNSTSTSGRPSNPKKQINSFVPPGAPVKDQKTDFPNFFTKFRRMGGFRGSDSIGTPPPGIR